ncbi:kinase-like domain-containing protein [Amylocarpus encephaloides]|uniref:dual-specificity kinase n=1 Tax=Amylocarpus encephaloides TaxID=45428 RepID=A0A9P8C443_9HELO|nr:kinase-like domain-containing protein [Amylocarpus encephaloides]
MSTPSTLPPHHPNYGYSHHQNYPSNGGYRTNSTLLNGGSRLGGSYSFPTPSSNDTSSNSVIAPEPLLPSQNATHTSSGNNSKPDAMPSSSSIAAATKPKVKRRQRSREPRKPDWKKFYEKGLPNEVIVIDDSPPPSESLASDSLHARSIAAESSRQPAKKRKRDDVGTAYDVIYGNGHANSIHQSPGFKDSASGSTISTDRTTSAIHTTAATSLGSHSSNGQNGYETADVQPGQKRRRVTATTRLQTANENKRRELEVNGDAYTNYKPPPRPPIKAPDIQVKVVHDTSYTKNTKVDDDDGHYIVVPDSNLTERYQVTKLLGQGTFGKVVQARDRRRNKFVAIKIIRSVQKYRDASRIELRVLSTLKLNDHENRNRCIHLRDCFDYRDHICIVMDLLGQSVFDFLKGNSFVPFPNSQIQSFARQLFTSVAFLHDLNLIHTDLKPENILLCDNSYQAFTYSRRIPSSSTTQNRQAAQRKVLLDTEIRLIDFGSATFQEEYHSSVVSTRHYRAPEIILGLGWTFPCDIWSIGCILVEFFTGDALFQTHDNLEHLAMMEAVCGSKIDTHLIQAVASMGKGRSSANPATKFFKRSKLDYPQQETTRASRRFVKAMKRLDEIIPDSNKFCKNFLDLLKKIFVYDPQNRITAKEALQHPWFKEAATPDDGTEATKIRMQRQQTAAVAAKEAEAAARHNGYRH